MDEIWKPVPDYLGLYEASNLGRIRSLNFDPPLVRKLWMAKDGYWHITLYRPGGVVNSFKVHRLVCRAFHGEPVGILEACHIDGCRTNNTASNLKWATHAENCRDKIEHGTILRGEAHPRAKLTEADVEAIWAESGTMPKPELAAKFGVSVHTICDIFEGKNWTHITAKLPKRISYNSNVKRILPPDAIRAIEASLKEGMKPPEIARKHGISRSRAYRYAAQINGAAPKGFAQKEAP